MSTVKVSFKSHILQRAFQYLRNIDGIFVFWNTRFVFVNNVSKILYFHPNDFIGFCGRFDSIHYFQSGDGFPRGF